MLEFVKVLSSQHKRRDTLTPDQWSDAYSKIPKGQGLTSYLSGIPAIQWSKIAYIDGLTSSASKLMQVAARYAIGLTSSTLPMCVIPKEKRVAFSKEVEAIYPDIKDSFVSWLSLAT